MGTPNEPKRCLTSVSKDGKARRLRSTDNPDKKTRKKKSTERVVAHRRRHPDRRTLYRRARRLQKLLLALPPALRGNHLSKVPENLILRLVLSRQSKALIDLLYAPGMPKTTTRKDQRKIRRVLNAAIAAAFSGYIIDDCGFVGSDGNMTRSFKDKLPKGGLLIK